MILLLWACSSPPPVPASPELLPLSLGSSNARTSWQALESLTTGTFQFPPDNLPPEGATEARFPLSTPWTSVSRLAGYQVWETPLPFHSEAPRPNYAPYGAVLRMEGEVLPYVNDAEDLDGGGWLVDHDSIRLLLNRDPNGHAWVLEAPELEATQKRLNFQLSGLSATEFAKTTITIGRQTRQGLLVPAPGEASFSVEIPEGARLEFGVSMVDLPLGSTVSDGAAAELWVGEEKRWSETVMPGQEFSEVVVDLGKDAGKKVNLRFVTTPGHDSIHDAVVFTAPTLRAPRDTAPRHVFLVGIDTLRYDALSVNGREVPTSSALDTWANDALVFDDALAPAPRTRPSFRSLLTGRYPLSALHAPVLAELLQRAGFRTAGFAANIHLVPRFHFNAGFEVWDYENGARADVQIDRALAWVKSHQDEDTFVFLHLMDPHTFYDAPGSYRNRFVTTERSGNFPELFNRWEVINRMKTGRMDQPTRAWIRARYDGEVAFVTDQLLRFFREVEPLSQRTLELLVSDHGEEFWDHDGYEHNHSLYQELVHVVMMIKPPGGWSGGPHRNREPVGLYDVVPTILDALDIPKEQWGELDGISLRPLIDAGQAGALPALSQRLADRPRIQGHLMFDTERWSVVDEGWKYILHTASGREELYNLATDPTEQHNRARDTERISQLREAMQKGSGWPVRPALRLELSGTPATPFTVYFDGPVEEVGVVDPEASRTIRANLEWGEKPLITPSEVATIRLSEDRKEVSVIPGSHYENQTLFVACPPSDQWTCPAGTLNGHPLIGPHRFGHFSVEATLGAILLQRVTEAEALSGTVSDTQIEQLKALGYLKDD